MSLTVSKEYIVSSDIGKDSSLPPICDMNNVQQMTESYGLDEDDGLFVGYGFLPSIYPYKMQDLYDRSNDKREYTVVTLENKYLKAEFLPGLGGKMRSLKDKVTGRDLLFCNPVIRPCNLAVRNAWTSGGVEFNCGMVGHHPYTCSPIFAGLLKLDDGTPVLRMYEYERIRRAVYQMDFFLPEDSKFLYARMRIVNPNSETVPMYWWSNIAVKSDKNARNIIDATETYNNCGDGVHPGVGKNKVPYFNGIDITYPGNNPRAVDYFWHIPDKARKFTTYLDKDGYGLVQTSTSRQQGRKLFVWGQGRGGQKWQSFLTGDGEDGNYYEIQAGIAHTQYETLPMPPKTCWEWLEAYGALKADPERVHGEWEDARACVRETLENALGEEYLEKMLKDTLPMAKRSAETMISYGSGWGALENIRRKSAGLEPVCPQLDFGTPGREQKPWINLIENKKFELEEYEDGFPGSWMLDDTWRDILLASKPCYDRDVQLAALYFGKQNIDKASEFAKRALKERRDPDALFIFAQVKRVTGKISECIDLLVEASVKCSANVSLIREAMKLIMRFEPADYPDIILELYKAASAEVKKDGRVRMYAAFAYVRLGKPEKAKKILLENGGLVVSDIREGETSITALYIETEIALAAQKGKKITADDVDVPDMFNFRMDGK